MRQSFLDFDVMNCVPWLRSVGASNVKAEGCDGDVALSVSQAKLCSQQP